MSSNEEQAKDNLNSTDFASDRLSTAIIKYFWQASPLARTKKNSIHRFFRKIEAFENLTDYEVFLFSKFLHVRNFDSNEIVFKEGDGGFGFYLIYSGAVNIYTHADSPDPTEMNFITELDKYNHFGELSLLEKQNNRNATAITKSETTLLAIYKPDLEELIERYPIVGAKFLQALSWIVAKRLNGIANELKKLKSKLKEAEAYANTTNEEV